MSCFWTHFAAPLAAQLEMDIADANKGDTDDFERGGGMRTDVDALLVEHKAAIAELVSPLRTASRRTRISTMISSCCGSS